MYGFNLNLTLGKLGRKIVNLRTTWSTQQDLVFKKKLEWQYQQKELTTQFNRWYNKKYVRAESYSVIEYLTGTHKVLSLIPSNIHACTRRWAHTYSHRGGRRREAERERISNFSFYKCLIATRKASLKQSLLHKDLKE